MTRWTDPADYGPPAEDIQAEDDLRAARGIFNGFCITAAIAGLIALVWAAL